MSLVPQKPDGAKGKKPRVKWSRYQKEPAEPDQVMRWHDIWPRSLWAVVTGDVSDIIVLDFDGPEGLATLAQLGLQATVTTPSGGAHVWVTAPAARLRSQGYGPNYPGMEVKAEGAMATFYGKRRDGTAYRLVQDAITDWSDLPDELRQYISSAPHRSRSAGKEGVRGRPPTTSWIAGKLAEAVQKVEAGEGRNHVGHWFIQQLWWNDCDVDTVWQWGETYRASVDHHDHPYETQEINDTVRQVLQEERREPEAERDTKRPVPVGPVITSLSDMKPRAVAWLWPKRIAYGKVTNFEGDAEQGKSLVTLDLGARATRARPFPDGVAVEPAALLLLCVEDDFEDTILPRLLAANADRGVCFQLVVQRDDHGTPIPFTLPDDMPILTRAIDEVKETTGRSNVIVIVDPVSAYLSERINSNNDASVRRAMSPLAELAQNTGAAFWLVRHLNKNSSESNVQYRGGGSIAFFAAARHVFVFGRDQDDPTSIVMAQSKNNIGPKDQPSLKYHIEAEDGDDEITMLRVVWDGVSELTADQVLAKKDGRTGAPQREQATRLLLESIDGQEELLVAEAQQHAIQLGISKATLGRAASELGLISDRVVGTDGKVDHWIYRWPFKDGRVRFQVRPSAGSKRGSG